MIRIISGTHKGRRISAPRNLPVRPTTDRAKEALFNILAPQIHWPDASVLDLFAGTGNISYECASRGCPSVTAVDAHPGCVAFIRKTAEALGMPLHAVRKRAASFLEQSAAGYTVIFADPPYDLGLPALEGLVNTCMEGPVLAADGLLVVEHPKTESLEHLPGFREARRYGGTVFSFFEKK